MKKVLIALIFGYTILSVPFSVFTASAEVSTISALELQQTFLRDPTTTEDQYLNKTIQLTGIVTESSSSLK